MANSQSNLPEGTDSIIPGSSSGSTSGVEGFTSDTGFSSSTSDASSSDAYSSGASTGYSSSVSAKSARDDAAEKLGDTAAKVGDATAGLRAQATDKVYGFVGQGKDRAVGLLDNVTQLVDDAAAQIDEKAGEQYGAYARQASQAVAGFADTLRDKDVDALVGDARDLVRKSPAIAIGAAAAVGFLLARVLKVGLAEGASATSAPTTDSPYVAPTVPASTPTTATTVPVDTAF